MYYLWYDRRSGEQFSDPIRQQKMDSGFGIPKSDRLLIVASFPGRSRLQFLIDQKLEAGTAWERGYNEQSVRLGYPESRVHFLLPYWI